jgi:hypothetical protein
MTIHVVRITRQMRSDGGRVFPAGPRAECDGRRIMQWSNRRQAAPARYAGTAARYGFITVGTAF